MHRRTLVPVNRDAEIAAHVEDPQAPLLCTVARRCTGGWRGSKRPGRGGIPCALLQNSLHHGSDTLPSIDVKLVATTPLQQSVQGCRAAPPPFWRRPHQTQGRVEVVVVVHFLGQGIGGL